MIALRRLEPIRPGPQLPLIALLPVGALLGAALMAGAARFGDAAPAVALAVPLAGLLALAALARPALALLATFLCFPAAAVAVPLGAISLQAVEIAALLATSMVLGQALAAGALPPWAPQLWWALALLAWLLVGLSSAVDAGLAVKQAASLTVGIALACAVMAACRSVDDVRLLLAGLVAATAFTVLMAVAGGVELEATLGGTTVSGRLQGPFDHPNELGSLCALAAPVGAALALGARARISRLAALAALGVTLAGLVLSLTRGAWIGTALAFAILVAAVPGARRAALALAVPLALAGALAWSLAGGGTAVEAVGARAQSVAVLSPYDDRSAIWREAWHEIAADPVTGQGAAGFPVASARGGSEASTVFAEHAHSLVLTWGAEAGLPAIGTIVGLALSLAVGARRAAARWDALGDQGARVLVLGVGGALAAVAVGQGLFDYTLRNPVIWTALWVLIGALLALGRLSTRKETLSPWNAPWTR